MSVAFVFDQGNADGSVGGAELTLREFAAAGETCDLSDAETVVVGNCVTFGPELIDDLKSKRVIRYHNDLARHENDELRKWLNANATHIFTSPLHQELYGLDGAWPNIPPAVDLRRFRVSRQSKRNGKRSGAVCIASFQNHGKGAQLLAEYAKANGGLTVYGTGSCVPGSPDIDFQGPLPYEKVQNVLWEAETFVHLPTAIEPFGRAVVEAWAAGCRLVINGNVGARHWIENEPGKLESASEDFWKVVCEST